MAQILMAHTYPIFDGDAEVLVRTLHFELSSRLVIQY